MVSVAKAAKQRHAHQATPNVDHEATKARLAAANTRIAHLEKSLLAYQREADALDAECEQLDAENDDLYLEVRQLQKRNRGLLVLGALSTVAAIGEAVLLLAA